MRKLLNSLIFLLIIAMLISLLSTNVFAVQKNFTITVKDHLGNFLPNITISMRNNINIATQVTKSTDITGKATFTMYDNVTYGFNIYDYNHNDACSYTNQYTTSSTTSGLTVTFPASTHSYSLYSNPIALGPLKNISSYYGYRFIEQTLNLHYGLDVAAPETTVIYNVANATYVDHNTNGNDPRGYWVLLKISPSTYVLYQHMSAVYSGTTSSTTSISEGSFVGYVGHTGTVYGNTGDHLHIEFLNSQTISGSNTYDPLRHIYR